MPAPWRTLCAAAGRFPRLSMRASSQTGVVLASRRRVPRPFSIVFKWQFENTSIFHFSFFIPASLFRALPEPFDHLAGQADAGIVAGDLVAAVPARLGQLALLDRDLVAAVQLAPEAEEQAVGKDPGLGFVVAQLFHPQAGLFQNLPAHRVLNRLADLGKAGHQRVALEGAALILRQQQTISVRDGNDHGGAELRIDRQTAVRADHGPFGLAVAHRLAAAAAEAVGPVPALQALADRSRKNRVLRPHLAVGSGGHEGKPLRRSRSVVSPRHKIGALIERERVAPLQRPRGRGELAEAGERQFPVLHRSKNRVALPEQRHVVLRRLGPPERVVIPNVKILKHKRTPFSILTSQFSISSTVLRVTTQL